MSSTWQKILQFEKGLHESKQQSESKWQELHNITTQISSKPLITKNKDLIIPIGFGTRSSVLSAFIKYDPIQEKSIEFLTLKRIYSCSLSSAAIDIENDTIYIPNEHGIHAIDLKSKEFNTQTVQNPQQYAFHNTPSSIIIGNKLHIFGHWQENHINKHTIRDLKTLHIQSNDISLPNDCKFSNLTRAVFIRSQMRILFIGNFKGNIISYDVNNDEWSLMDKIQLLSSRNGVISRGSPSAVILTMDEKFVIIIATKEGLGWNDDYKTVIEIVDIENNVVEVSKLKLPFSVTRCYNLYGFSVDGASDILINGYVRNCWKDKEFEGVNELPFELICVMVRFCAREEIHLVQASYGKHWKIDLDDILQSCAFQ